MENQSGRTGEKSGGQDGQVRYRIDEQEDLKFIIENYTRARPFTSFFPGIAGLAGIPMWCFYVNRGQAVCSFGTESKDGAIMEFQPANKAYRLVGSHGFRTFLKYRRGTQEGFYEPFSESNANRGFDMENRMVISPWDLCIEERNETLGIGVSVTYFTIPEEPAAGLARKVTISNLGSEGLRLVLLDGMPVIAPYGMWDAYMKNMSRTIEAWACVENLDRKAPFYRLKVNAEDGPEVIQVKAGNFHAGFYRDKRGIAMLEPIIDPEAVFGHVTDLSYPEEFCKKDFSLPGEQCDRNRTACALGYAELELSGGESAVVCSVTGHAKSLESLNSLIAGFLDEQFILRKEERNRQIIREILDKAFVNSGSRAFNSYSRQTFLDNVLRGGMPVSLEAAGKKEVLHVFSRRHGDPERDYNSFRLMPEYYSQGNGAYRDICQNRRNDVWFNPDTGRSDIIYFINLIQLDGFNPLIVKGVSYRYAEDGEAFLHTLVEGKDAAKLAEFVRKPFFPHTLLGFLKTEKIKLRAPVQELISGVIVRSGKYEEAEHGEGYWSDHWHYNLDLLESYEALYPDGMAALLAEERLFSFYEDEYVVVPRKDRYVLYGGRPRQFNCLRKDEGKLEMLAARACGRNRVRSGNGRGDIYYTSLWTKLLCLCVNKTASLDANGTGVEMEAGKPNWNDALNGLPSFFGSSVNETFELKRLIVLLQQWLERYGPAGGGIKIPVELALFLTGLREAFIEAGNQNSGESSHKYWEMANKLKEEYREAIRYGLKGAEAALDGADILDFLKTALARVEMGLAKAFDPVDEIYHTYFMNEPIEYEELAGAENREEDAGQDAAGPESASGAGVDKKAKMKGLRVKRFEQIPLPPFLEGQVHALRTEKDPVKARRLYDAVRQTALYDRELGMYKTNAGLADFPMEIGRIRAFTPGWLENESVFLHMEYKYLLELLKSGLVEEFFKIAPTALVPFMDPAVYGRSIFENSSFIASSVNPDRRARGCGFVARLSGTTAEFCNMLLVMAAGVRPFSLNASGDPELKLAPLLPGWLFTESRTETKIWINGKERELLLEPNTFCSLFLGHTLLVYHNGKRRDTFGAAPAEIEKTILSHTDGRRIEIAGGRIPSPFAAGIRSGLYSRIDAFLQ